VIAQQQQQPEAATAAATTTTTTTRGSKMKVKNQVKIEENLKRIMAL
jgi:hypothetical protein